MSATPDLSVVPAIPVDADGAVFNSPWEAKIFSLIVSLHQQGHFAWTEWAATISDEIDKDKGSQPETPYYELWLRAAERIIEAKGICNAAELAALKAALLAAQAHDHDHPHEH
jgi:nitrile hydratase accessory protein